MASSAFNLGSGKIDFNKMLEKCTLTVETKSIAGNDAIIGLSLKSGNGSIIETYELHHVPAAGVWTYFVPVIDQFPSVSHIPRYIIKMTYNSSSGWMLYASRAFSANVNGTATTYSADALIANWNSYTTVQYTFTNIVPA